VIVDVNCWGALSAADARCAGRRIRDAAIRPLVMGMLEKGMLPPLNKIRADIGAPPVASADGLARPASCRANALSSTEGMVDSLFNDVVRLLTLIATKAAFFSAVYFEMSAIAC